MYIHMYIFFSGVVRRLRSLHTKGECYCYLQAHDIQGVGWPRKTQHRGGRGGWVRDQPPTQHWRGVGRVLSPTLSEINKINIKKVLGTTTPFLTNWDFFFFLLAQIADNSASNFRKKTMLRASSCLYQNNVTSFSPSSIHLAKPRPRLCKSIALVKCLYTIRKQINILFTASFVSHFHFLITGRHIALE